MSDPKVAGTTPIAFEVEAGKNYAWCSCGHSSNQPLCDGSHSGTGMSPHVFQAEESKTVYFCNCKHTAGAPFCDGSHSKVSADS